MILHFLPIFSVSHRLHGPFHFIQCNNLVCKITLRPFSGSRKIEFLHSLSLAIMCTLALWFLCTPTFQSKMENELYFIALNGIRSSSVEVSFGENKKMHICKNELIFFSSFLSKSMLSFLSYEDIWMYGTHINTQNTWTKCHCRREMGNGRGVEENMLHQWAPILASL